MPKHQIPIEQLDKAIDLLQAEIRSLTANVPHEIVDALKRGQREVRQARDAMIALDHDAERSESRQ